jgi:hypothetical protein
LHSLRCSLLLVLTACQSISDTSSQAAPENAPVVTPKAAAAPRSEPAPSAAPVRRADPRPVLPPAKSGFTLKASAEGKPTLEDLLAEMGTATGVHFLVHEQTRPLLRATQLHLPRDLVVPAQSAWQVAEVLLAQNDCLIFPMHRDKPWLVSVVALSASGSGNLKAYAVEIDAADLERYAEHSALLVMTVLDVDPLDARQIATSLRQAVSRSAHAVDPPDAREQLAPDGLRAPARHAGADPAGIRRGRTSAARREPVAREGRR